MTTRLRDLTLEEHALQQRQACLLVAMLRDQYSVVRSEPGMLAQFLAARRASDPVASMVKAAVAAGTTTDATWAGPLAQPRPLIGAFLAAVDRESVLGRLGAVRVPVANAVGAGQTVNATAYWLGESSPKPLSALGFAALALRARKCVADVAVTSELLRMANVDMLAILDRAVVSAVARAVDEALFDPANAGIVDVKPASLTNGLTPITPAGDFQNQIGQVFAAISGGAPARPVLVVSLQSALRLTGLRDLAEAGITVITTPAAGDNLVAIDADGVAYADDGGELKIGEPTVEMSDTPANPSIASTVFVSAFQANLKVVRGERWTNWSKRADAVAYLELA